MAERRTDRLAVKAEVKVEFGAASHIGCVRTENQDSWGKFPRETLDVNHPKGLLFLVADGMGGHQAGKVASELAVSAVSECYFKDDDQDAGRSLLKSFQLANGQIHEKSMTDESYAGMGTTCTALVVRSTDMHIAHVGDSRVYRVRRNQMDQLTTDHSRIAALYRQGFLTKEEAQSHPERSLIYRALGVRPHVDVDTLEETLRWNDIHFVLCSDGLTTHVSDDEINRELLSHSPQQACDALVHIVNTRGGTDNVTVLVVHVSKARRFGFSSWRMARQ